MNLVIGLIMIFLRNITISTINKMWKQLIMRNLPLIRLLWGLIYSQGEGEIEQSHHAKNDDQQYEYER
mgnify:CR=1 FL=1